MTSKVRKAVIPAAGLGTRFLPATKALAKEMLPIVDKPTIQFIVEEALKSGIEDILVVTGKSKRSIEDHFDSNFELEYNLKEKGKHDLLKLVDETTGMRLHFIRQTHPRGLGDAVLQAKAFVGNEPFVVMLGDDLMDITDEGAVPLTKQLMNDYEKTHASTIAVMPVPHEEVSAYGVIAPQGEGSNGLYSVETFVENQLQKTLQVIWQSSDAICSHQKFLKSSKIKLPVLEMRSSLPTLLIHLIKLNVFSPVNLQELVTTLGINSAL